MAAEDLRNVLVESVNARDPELIEQVDLPEVAELEATIQTMNERWPRMMMTRGDIGDRPVAVVWMPDQNERYQQVAHVVVVPEETGAHTELVEEVDPAMVAESPPADRGRVGECSRNRPRRWSLDLTASYVL